MLQKLAKVRKNRKGFTLIELIVVIAVLGILVTMGVPRYLGYTKDAKVATMQADAKIIEQAAYQYALNNDDQWPIDEEAAAPEPTWDFEKLVTPEGETYNVDDHGAPAAIAFNEIDNSIRSLSGDKADYFIVKGGPFEGCVFTVDALEDSQGNLHSGLEEVSAVGSEDPQG